MKYENRRHRLQQWCVFCCKQLQRKYDWWIYRRAFHSLRRMTLDNPGLSYLMELQMHEWNKNLNISPNLKYATEQFHEAMRNQGKNQTQINE
jgi:hypothetical protein